MAGDVDRHRDGTATPDGLMRIRRAATRMHHLINDLLAHSTAGTRPRSRQHPARHLVTGQHAVRCCPDRRARPRHRRRPGTGPAACPAGHRR
ncbi:hypothetical protein [Spirillospora albida]|uniref:hypothetical protein n=1 Tax=Spirillospora albida TaxID=58123 RepID=UPI003CCBC97F